MREVGFLYPLSQDRCTVPWWPFKWASPSRRGQLFRNSLEPTLKSQSIHCGLEAMPGWVGNVSSLIFLHCNCYSLDFVLSLKQLVSQRHWNQPDSTSHLSSDLWTLLRINRSLVSVTFMYERLLVLTVYLTHAVLHRRKSWQFHAKTKDHDNLQKCISVSVLDRSDFEQTRRNETWLQMCFYCFGRKWSLISN